MVPHHPRVYHMTTHDPPTTYNYNSDTFGKSELLPLGIAGSRKTLEMTYLPQYRPLQSPERMKSDHKENLFESFTIGLGAAIEEERVSREAANKQKQVFLNF